MVWDAVGVTGWGLDQLARLTMPQLWSLLRHRGRVLWPRVEAALDAQRAQGLHDDPKLTAPGEPTPVQRTLDSWERAKRGQPEPRTLKDERYARAYAITYAKYLGNPEEASAVQQGRAKPFAGMSRAEARGIVAWVQSGAYTMPAWEWLANRWDEVVAAAELEGG